MTDKMSSEEDRKIEWIYTLPLERLREELGNRGQSTDGTVSALRSRLIKFERCAQLGWEPPRTPTNMGPPEIDDLAEGAAARPDSRAEPVMLSNEGADTERTRVQLRSPRLELPHRDRENRAASRNNSSAVDVYQLMRRWNLKFSGARGSDAEAFLTRIEEGRALVVVENEEIFKCIPFFLSGIALYWYRNEHGRWRTWRDFESAWRARFGSPDFQFALRDEIMRRTQGERESVANFLT